jgi:hypothetical protein
LSSKTKLPLSWGISPNQTNIDHHATVQSAATHQRLCNHKYVQKYAMNPSMSQMIQPLIFVDVNASRFMNEGVG